MGWRIASGAVGKYLMDHDYSIRVSARMEGFDDKYYNGGRPNGIYIPRFRNIDDKHPDFLRGYGFQGGGSRTNWNSGFNKPGFGAEFKDSLTHPGPWSMRLVGFGECLPYENNAVSLNKEVLDKHGLPTLHISAAFRENERAMRDDIATTASEMLEAAGGKDIQVQVQEVTPGFCIHEMGTARMGRDPKTSVLNKWNQAHDVDNLFVTDGACMASSACQNPSITYMALTARAVDYAVKELKNGNLS